MVPKNYYYMTVNITRMLDVYEKIIEHYQNSFSDLNYADSLSHIVMFKELIESHTYTFFREMGLDVHNYFETTATPIVARHLYKDPIITAGIRSQLIPVIESCVAPLLKFKNSVISVNVVGQLLHIVVTSKG